MYLFGKLNRNEIEGGKSIGPFSSIMLCYGGDIQSGKENQRIILNKDQKHTLLVSWPANSPNLSIKVYR